MAFEREKPGFHRDARISRSIEKGSTENDFKETKINFPRRRKRITKKYMTLSVYPNVKKMLREESNERGISISEMIDHWARENYHH